MIWQADYYFDFAEKVVYLWQAEMKSLQLYLILYQASSCIFRFPGPAGIFQFRKSSKRNSRPLSV